MLWRAGNHQESTSTNGSKGSLFEMSNETLATVRVVNKIFDVYIPPVIFILGVTGNVLAIIVMSRPRFNKLTTAFYMRILAVFDTNLLTVVFVQHYLESNYSSYVAGQVFCKSFLFTDFSGFGLSNWVLVVMTMDRFLAVQFPFKSPIWCTIKRAKWSTVVIFIYFTTTNVHVILYAKPLFTSEDNTLFCEIDVTEFWKEAFYLYDMVVTILVPFFVLIFLNVQIIRCVTKSNEQRKEMSSVGGNITRVSKKGEQRERQLTFLLILVSIVFLITSLPYAIDFIVWEQLIDYEDGGQLEEIRNCSSSITYKFLYINPMINFYLYCLGCSKFRFELKTIFFCKICCKIPSRAYIERSQTEQRNHSTEISNQNGNSKT